MSYFFLCLLNQEPESNQKWLPKIGVATFVGHDGKPETRVGGRRARRKTEKEQAASQFFFRLPLRFLFSNPSQVHHHVQLTPAHLHSDYIFG